MENKKTILLVDDDVDILEQSKFQLVAHGFDVVTAENTKEGFELFEQIKPYAVVLDLMMEEYDSGFILSHKMKRTPFGKQTPIFLVTAVTNVTGLKFDTTTSEESEWIKADGVMAKPIIIDDLLKRIDAFYEKVNH